MTKPCAIDDVYTGEIIDALLRSTLRPPASVASHRHVWQRVQEHVIKQGVHAGQSLPRTSFSPTLIGHPIVRTYPVFSITGVDGR